MTKNKAQAIWNADIEKTAKTYYQEFEETNLDSEWSCTGFTESGCEFNEAAEVFGKDWQDYHDEVQEKLLEVE